MVKFNGKIKRINGYLHIIEPVFDSAGKIVNFVASPLMVELRWRDVMQIIVGSAILSIPVGFTQEVWDLAQELPIQNILILGGISILFIALYVYFNFYRYNFKNNVFKYIKRVVAIYSISLFVVSCLLYTINRLPIINNPLLAIKTAVIVAFPASMSAAISDTIK